MLVEGKGKGNTEVAAMLLIRDIIFVSWAGELQLGCLSSQEAGRSAWGCRDPAWLEPLTEGTGEPCPCPTAQTSSVAACWPPSPPGTTASTFPEPHSILILIAGRDQGTESRDKAGQPLDRDLQASLQPHSMSRPSHEEPQFCAAAARSKPSFLKP